MSIDQGLRDRGGGKGIGLDEDLLFRVPELTDHGLGGAAPRREINIDRRRGHGESRDGNGGGGAGASGSRIAKSRAILRDLKTMALIYTKFGERIRPR